MTREEFDALPVLTAEDCVEVNVVFTAPVDKHRATLEAAGFRMVEE